jgi:hypothetical protein
VKESIWVLAELHTDPDIAAVDRPKCDAEHSGPGRPLLTFLVNDDTGTACHVSKQCVLSPRVDLPVGFACGLGAYSWLDWPFGLWASRAHGLLKPLNLGRHFVATLTRQALPIRLAPALR